MGFFSLSRSYFYKRTSRCPLCLKFGLPTLTHLLFDCRACTDVCVRHDLPPHHSFLRVALLSRTGRELASLTNDLSAILSLGTARTDENSTPVVALTSRPPMNET